VAEDAGDPPTPPTGHAHLALAVLHRPPSGTQIVAEQIEDRRLLLNSAPRIRQLSLPPVFLPVAGRDVWAVQSAAGKIRATSPNTARPAGVLPLALPDGARLTAVRLRAAQTGGSGSGFSQFTFRLNRSGLGGAADGEQLAGGQQPVPVGAPLDRELTPLQHVVVDNTRSSYHVLVASDPLSGTALTFELHSVTIVYEY
jgi:hypothetical protein